MIKSFLRFTLSSSNQNRQWAWLWPVFSPWIRELLSVPRSTIPQSNPWSWIWLPCCPRSFWPRSVPLLALLGWGYSQGHYHPTGNCPAEKTHSPLWGRDLTTHRAWLEASVSPSPLTPFWKLAAKEERWQLGTHPVQWLFSAVQTLLNAVAISYISAKRGKEYFDNKDTAAPGWSEEVATKFKELPPHLC